MLHGERSETSLAFTLRGIGGREAASQIIARNSGQGVSMHLRIVFLLALLLVLLALTVPSHLGAQTNTVNLSGTVLDPQNLAVKGSKIMVKNLANGAERTATSDSNGRYEIVGLPPGAYEMTVEAQGFATLKNPSLTLTIGTSPVYDPQ